MPSLRWPFWSDAERRPRAAVRIALQLAMLLAPLPLLLWANAAVHRALEANVEVLFAVGALSILGATAVLFATWLAARLFDRRSLDQLGLGGDASFWADGAFGFALGATLIGGIALTESSLGWATYREAPSLGEVPRVAFVPAVLVVFVAVALYEEVLFRGYYLTNLAEGLACRVLPGPFAVAAATLLSSLIFGVMHAGNPSATPLSTGNIVLAGVMLATGYVATGRLGVPIGLHLAWNFTQNLLGMPVSGLTEFFPGALLEREPSGPAWITGGAFGPEAGATGVVAMFVGTLLTLAWVRAREGRLRLCASIAEPPPLVRASLAAARRETRESEVASPAASCAGEPVRRELA